jgi:hypothetical protein
MDPVLDIPLEIFGQNDVLSIQTPFVYIFPCDEPNPDISKFTDTIHAGLVGLTKAFPWIAGKIVNTGRTETSSGVFKITSHTSIPNFVVKDWRNDSNAPTMAALVDSEVPCSMLKEKFFAPITVLPSGDEDRSPLLQLQLSIITGGVVLSVMANHQAMDGTAQDQICYLLDKACNGIPYTDEEIRIGNLEREGIVDIFDDDWQPPLKSMYRAKPTSKKNEQEHQPQEDKVEHHWISVLFSPSSLSTLKSTISHDFKSGFVSTDDALTALIWQSLAKARLGRFPPSTTTTIGRSVNPRKYIGIPATYPGYISNNAYSTHTLLDLANSPLASIAAELRSKVANISEIRDTTKEFATLLHRASDKNEVNINATLDLDVDVIFSSWANMRGYQFDFGLGLGKPTYFRRMDHLGVPSLGFLLPKRPDGENILSICLRTDDIEALRSDPVFAAYGRFLNTCS